MDGSEQIVQHKNNQFNFDRVRTAQIRNILLTYRKVDGRIVVQKIKDPVDKAKMNVC